MADDKNTTINAVRSQLGQIFNNHVTGTDAIDTWNRVFIGLTDIQNMLNTDGPRGNVERMELLTAFQNSVLYGPCTMPAKANKLREEVAELLKVLPGTDQPGGDNGQIIDEMSDVLHVLTVIANYYGSNLFTLLHMALDKSLGRSADNNYKRKNE